MLRLLARAAYASVGRSDQLKQRVPASATDGQFRAVSQDDAQRCVRRMSQLHHATDVHQSRSMQPREGGRIETALQRIERLTDHQSSIAPVQHRAGAVRFEPIDVLYGYKERSIPDAHGNARRVRRIAPHRRFASAVFLGKKLAQLPMEPTMRAQPQILARPVQRSRHRSFETGFNR